MPKKYLKLAKCVRSVPQLGSRCASDKDSSRSLSSRSSLSTIKQLKKAQFAEKKAAERAGRWKAEPAQKHLVSRMTPYFYPTDYELEPSDDDPAVPPQLATAYWYPVTDTVEDHVIHPPRPDVAPSHLESHLTPYCRPVDDGSATVEDSSPKSARHLESHVTLQHRMQTGDDMNEDNELVLSLIHISEPTRPY